MRKLLLLLALAFCANVQAQDDVFAISQFEMDSKFLARAPSLNTALDLSSGHSRFDAPINLRKKADSVTLSIFLTNESRKASERNDQIMETVTAIIEKAEKTDGIRAHNGEISLSTRNNKVSIFSSGDESSRVRIFILGDLAGGEDVFTKTSEMKKFLEKIKPVGETKLEEGNIGLSIKGAQSYRTEILQLILGDINSIKETLGGSVDMNITGLDRKVVVKQANESEVDLLIPYSFTLEHSTKMEAE